MHDTENQSKSLSDDTVDQSLPLRQSIHPPHINEKHEKALLPIVWCAHYPNVGQNIQQISIFGSNSVEVF